MSTQQLGETLKIESATLFEHRGLFSVREMAAAPLLGGPAKAESEVRKRTCPDESSQTAPINPTEVIVC